MTDHTPQHDDALVTAYALGELDPQSDDYQSIAAKAADDAALHDQIEQIAALGDRLTQSYAQAAGPGLDDAALAAVVDSATAPIARIRPRPTLTRRLLPYAGVAACAALATAGALLAIQSAGVAPSNQTQTTPNDRLAPGDTAVATLDPDDRNDDAQPTLPIAPKPLTPAQQLAAKLDAPLDIDIEKATLSAFFDLIRDETETNFVVNWPALELVGIDRDSPLTMQFKNVPARAAIDLALQQVSADAFDDDKAGLRITEHFVEVSTRRDLKTDVETRVYDMDDLLTKGTVLARLKHQLAERLALAKPTPGGSLFGDDSGSGLFADSDGFEPLAPLSVEGVPNADPASKLNTPGDSLYGRGLPRVDIPDFTTVPGFDLNDSLSGTNSGGSTGGSGGSLFGDSDDRDADYDYAEDLPSRQEIVDQYVELIQSTVGDPDEWLDEESTLTEIAGRFVIKTTPENHEQIDRLLGILRPEKKVEAEQDEVLDGVADALIADIELGMLAVEQRRELRAIERERRERFADLTDNPFKLVANEPLSTFSVDVDTASYTYSRRSILTEDTLPNPDAVRIEEWINYFDYGYAAPTVDLDRLDSGRLTTAALQRIEADDASFVPFATDVEVVASPWTEGNQLVRVGLKAMEVDRSNRPPAHLVFLLDVSGSMDRDDKLGLVKKGMPMLLDQLNDRDKVSIVVYAGASGLVLEAAPAEAKQQIRDAIEALSAGGSTAGGAGIQLAYDIAEKHYVQGGINRVILCTDGDFNVGTSDTDQLVELVQTKANPPANPDADDPAKGVYLSVLGFGTGNLNDEMMEKITNAGNGNYAYIDSVSEAVKTLRDQAGGTLVTVAKDVKLQLEFNPAQVARYRLIGYENRVLRDEDFNNDTVDAGDIGSGHSVTALYEIVPVPQANKPDQPKPDAQPLVDELRYQRPRDLADAAALPELLTLKLRYKPVDAEAKQGTSRRVVEHVPTGFVPFAEASEATRFASSVAAMGMILRGSPHKGTATTKWVALTAEDAKTFDPHGYRDEFFRLATRVGAIEAKNKEAFGQHQID